MKSRTLSIILAAVMLIAALPIMGCGSNGGEQGSENNGEYGCASYRELADAAVEMVQSRDAAKIRKMITKNEEDYKTAQYADREQGYYELVQLQIDDNCAKYDELCGEDWVITYEFTKVNEKDAEGVQNYRDFDAYYFKEYGIDPAKIEAATFIYADVTVTGSLGSYTKQRSYWTFCYEGRWYSLYMPLFALNLTPKDNA